MATTSTPTRSRRPRPGIEPGKPRWRRRLSTGFAVLYLALCLVIAFDLDDGLVTRTVPAADVAADLAASATCADDLLAEVGASVECRVSDGVTTHRVRATVTAVEGDDVSWDFSPMNL